MDIAVPGDLKVKLKETERRDKYLDLARELTKIVEKESNVYSNCNWSTYTVTEWLIKRQKDLQKREIPNKSGNHPNSIIEIGQNTEKSPKDFKRLGFPQTQVKGHQLMLLWKTLE